MLLQLHRIHRVFRSVALVAVLIAGSGAKAEPLLVAATSPAPEPIAAREAWRCAEEIIAAHPDCDVMIGSGGSMLPLYPDRTVLIVERLPMSALRAGMTVVFIGDRGRPVAHTLVEKRFFGWVAKGLANSAADRTLVRGRNYLGAVVRAFTPIVESAAGQ